MKSVGFYTATSEDDMKAKMLIINCVININSSLLLYYERPLLWKMLDDCHNNYLMLECDTVGSIIIYIVIPVTTMEIDKFLDNEIDLRPLFLAHRDQAYVTTNDNWPRVEAYPCDFIPESWMPSSGFFCSV